MLAIHWLWWVLAMILSVGVAGAALIVLDNGAKIYIDVNESLSRRRYRGAANHPQDSAMLVLGILLLSAALGILALLIAANWKIMVLRVFGINMPLGGGLALFLGISAFGALWAFRGLNVKLDGLHEPASVLELVTGAAGAPAQDELGGKILLRGIRRRIATAISHGAVGRIGAVLFCVIEATVILWGLIGSYMANRDSGQSYFGGSDIPSTGNPAMDLVLVVILGIGIALAALMSTYGLHYMLALYAAHRHDWAIDKFEQETRELRAYRARGQAQRHGPAARVDRDGQHDDRDDRAA